VKPHPFEVDAGDPDHRRGALYLDERGGTRRKTLQRPWQLPEITFRRKNMRRPLPSLALTLVLAVAGWMAPAHAQGAETTASAAARL
jgi:hypothetical protein